MRSKIIFMILFTLTLLATSLPTALASNNPFDIQSQFLNQARKERVHVSISLISGDKLEGYIKSFDSDCILVDSNGDILIYKHAISGITSTDGSFRVTSEEQSL